jgi:hypothetical protein
MSGDTCGPFLTRSGNRLVARSRGGGAEDIFLNGINLAWVRFGQDFVANDATALCGVEQALRFLVSHGGNAIRVWLFTEPSKMLVRGSDGAVVGLANSVIPMSQAIMRLALHYRVWVVFVLFNGALVRGASDCSIFGRDVALDSLIDNAIRPLVRALEGYENLGLWEVVNEVDGLLLPTSVDGSASQCTDVRSAAVHCPGHW